MRIEMVMPQMGESITEGTVVRWTKKVGDLVARDENVLEISTDKVDSEIPSPAAGRLIEIRAQEGQTIPVGQVIAVLETQVGAEAAGAPAGVPPAAAAPAPIAPATSAAPPVAAPAPIPPPAAAAAPIPPSAAAAAPVPPPAAAAAPIPPSAAAAAPVPPPAVAAAPIAAVPAPPADSPAAAPSIPPDTPVPPATVLIPRAPAPPSPLPPAPAVVPPVPAMAGGGPIPRHDGDHFYSPLVRSMARVEGVGIEELASLRGTGRDGRITRDDLAAYIAARRSGAMAPSATSAPASPAGADTGGADAAGAHPAGAAPAPAYAAPAPGGVAAGPGAFAPAAAALPGVSFFGPAVSGGVKYKPYPVYAVAETRATADGNVEVVKMDVMRQRIAEHMVRSKATSPHVYSVTECDLTGIVRLRESYKAEFERKHGFKLTYTPFIVAAAVRALLDYPMMNASAEGTEILVKRFVNIGVAVALESGLIVPVVKHAEEKNFLGLAHAITDLAARARAKKLVPDEVAGGTFAVTNMGGFGNLFGLPIINQPNVGILGAGAIVKRPVVLGEAIAIRDIMYLSLSYDHRIVDGALGGYFIQRVRHYLESGELAEGI